MKEFERAKKSYESVPIPEELNDRVQAGIRQGKSRRRRAAALRHVRQGAVAAAACFVVLVGGLNLSPAFAASAAEVPVLGGLFQVLTVRDYEMTQDGVHYDVSAPEVEADSALADKVNAEIQERVDGHLAEMEQMWQEYKDAFFATGGTEEEWGDREMNVIVDYEIKSQTDTTVSFVVNLFQGSFNAYNSQYFYNLDLENDTDITLADLLGEDWVSICNDAVQSYIDASVDEDGFTYFFSADQGGFTTVDETTSFYIREDGVPVVVFPEYSIAAGAAGTIEVPVETQG